MAGSRAHARLQLLVALLLALVCLVHGQLESRPPPLDKNGQPLSRGKLLQLDQGLQQVYKQLMILGCISYYRSSRQMCTSILSALMRSSVWYLPCNREKAAAEDSEEI